MNWDVIHRKTMRHIGNARSIQKRGATDLKKTHSLSILSLKKRDLWGIGFGSESLQLSPDYQSRWNQFQISEYTDALLTNANNFLSIEWS